MSDPECCYEGEEGPEVGLPEVEHDDGEEGEEGEEEPQAGDKEAQPDQNHHQDLTREESQKACRRHQLIVIVWLPGLVASLPSSSLQVHPLLAC